MICQTEKAISKKQDQGLCFQVSLKKLLYATE